jgi:hypothetical protein
MKWLILILILALTAPLSTAKETSILTLLKRDLGESIEVKSDTEIWYCPDNTCEIFTVNKFNPNFTTFIYLYLYHQSGYVYLTMDLGANKAFRKLAIEEPKIRLKVDSYCPQKIKSPACILKAMKQEMAISVCFGRYDEGEFNKECP